MRQMGDRCFIPDMATHPTDKTGVRRDSYFVAGTSSESRNSISHRRKHNEQHSIKPVRPISRSARHRRRNHRRRRARPERHRERCPHRAGCLCANRPRPNQSGRDTRRSRGSPGDEGGTCRCSGRSSRKRGGARPRSRGSPGDEGGACRCSGRSSRKRGGARPRSRGSSGDDGDPRRSSRSSGDPGGQPQRAPAVTFSADSLVA